jgi:hypothetical protein
MRTISAALVCALGLCDVPGRARAETIGVASEVVRTVLESTGDEFAPLAEGETLVRDQHIRSGHDGSALLTLRDASVIAVGPSSEVVLDAFVAPGGIPGISVARGVFRFISGPAGSGTHYFVKTPHASIAVRGTRFDVRVLGGLTTIVLDEGAVDVCVRGMCREMGPGTSVDVTTAGIYPTVTGKMLRWTFLTGASPGLRKLAGNAAVSADRGIAPVRAQAAHEMPGPLPIGRTGGGEGGRHGSFATASASASSSAAAGPASATADSAPAPSAPATASAAPSPSSPAGSGAPSGSGSGVSQVTTSQTTLTVQMSGQSGQRNAATDPESVASNEPSANAGKDKGTRNGLTSGHPSRVGKATSDSPSKNRFSAGGKAAAGSKGRNAR